MKYYRYIWDESRSDKYDYWGNSTWYFEIGVDGYIKRQIVLYQIGLTFKYSNKFKEDEFGQMGYTKFDTEEFDGTAVPKVLFEDLWIHYKKITELIDLTQYEIFERWDGDIDVLTDRRTGDKRDIDALSKYTFPLLNQIIEDKVCLKSQKYNSFIVKKINYRLKILTPLISSDVLDRIDMKIGII